MNITRLLVAAVAAAALTSVGGVALARHQTSLPSRPAGSAAVDWSAGAGHGHGRGALTDEARDAGRPGETGLANAIAHVSANESAHPNHGLETALDHLRANQARIAATLGG